MMCPVEGVRHNLVLAGQLRTQLSFFLDLLGTHLEHNENTLIIQKSRI